MKSSRSIKLPRIEALGVVSVWFSLMRYVLSCCDILESVCWAFECGGCSQGRLVSPLTQRYVLLFPPIRFLGADDRLKYIEMSSNRGGTAR
jgi:hypothetical protein